MSSKPNGRPKPPEGDAIDAMLRDYLQPILTHVGIYSWPKVKAEFDKARAQLIELRAKAAKANDSVAILRLVDDYFDRNMKLETSEEFQRLRHKVTKGISDATS